MGLLIRRRFHSNKTASSWRQCSRSVFCQPRSISIHDFAFSQTLQCKWSQPRWNVSNITFNQSVQRTTSHRITRRFFCTNLSFGFNLAPSRRQPWAIRNIFAFRKRIRQKTVIRESRHPSSIPFRPSVRYPVRYPH